MPLPAFFKKIKKEKRKKHTPELTKHKSIYLGPDCLLGIDFLKNYCNARSKKEKLR